MALPKASIANSASFQISGIPFVYAPAVADIASTWVGLHDPLMEMPATGATFTITSTDQTTEIFTSGTSTNTSTQQFKGNGSSAQMLNGLADCINEDTPGNTIYGKITAVADTTSSIYTLTLTQVVAGAAGDTSVDHTFLAAYGFSNPQTSTFSGSTKTIDFKYVTRAITVQSTGIGNEISFDGGANKITLIQNKPYRLKTKCKQLKITIAAGTVDFVAELTNVEAGQMPTIVQNNYQFIYGCIDPTANNYSSSSNTSDGSCEYLSANVIHLPLNSDSSQSGIAAVTIADAGNIVYTNAGQFGNSAFAPEGDDTDQISITSTTSDCADNALCWDGRFTVDFWYLNEDTSSYEMGDDSIIAFNLWSYLSIIYVKVAGVSKEFLSAGWTNDDNWHHIAITRDGNNDIRVFVDGNMAQLDAADSGVYVWNNSSTCDFGTSSNFKLIGDNDYSPTGVYIDDFRIVKGVAEWGANFATPLAEHDSELPSGFAECTSSESKPCGYNGNGSQIRTCTNSLWDAWAACANDPDVCTNGSVEYRTGPCTAPAQESRTCANGQWSDWDGICFTNDANVIHLPLNSDSAQSGIAAVTTTEALVTYASGEGHFANTGAVLFDEDSSYEKITITPDDTTCANNPLCWDGEFTIDFWIRIDNTVTNEFGYGQLARYGSGSTSAQRFYMSIYNNDDNGGTDLSKIRLYDRLGGTRYHYVVDDGTNTDGPGLSDNSWHHVAVTRDSSSEIRVFVDGVKKDLLDDDDGTGNVVTFTHNGTISFGDYMKIYSLPQDTYLSNVRFVKDCAVWTDNFTRPDEPSDGGTPSGC